MFDFIPTSKGKVFPFNLGLIHIMLPVPKIGIGVSIGIIANFIFVPTGNFLSIAAFIPFWLRSVTINAPSSPLLVIKFPFINELSRLCRLFSCLLISLITYIPFPLHKKTRGAGKQKKQPFPFRGCLTNPLKSNTKDDTPFLECRQ